MNRTKIEWPKNPDGALGYTWNPITGCLNHIDGMCKGGNFPCYAYKLATNPFFGLKERYLANTNYAIPRDKETEFLREIMAEHGIPPDYDPFYPRFSEDKLGDPHSGKGKGIFICDMSDLFGIGIPGNWTKQVMAVIEACPQHRFYLLTKQPQNLIKFSPFPDNCWVGVSATDTDMAYWGQYYLLQIEAKLKFMSFEPLLNWKPTNSQFFITNVKATGIKWVIIGSQTKPYKPPKIEWVQEIVQACDKTGIPVFCKDNLEKMCWGAGFEKIKDLSFWERIDHADDMVMAVDFRQEMPTIH